MFNYFVRVEFFVFFVDDGFFVGVILYYDVIGMMLFNFGFVYLFWVCWFVVVVVCIASVRY